MPYNIGDTGPAAYDLQRRQLAQERNNALLRQTLEMLQFGLQGKMAEQQQQFANQKWQQELSQQGVQNQFDERRTAAYEKAVEPTPTPAKPENLTAQEKAIQAVMERTGKSYDEAYTIVVRSGQSPKEPKEPKEPKVKTREEQIWDRAMTEAKGDVRVANKLFQTWTKAPGFSVGGAIEEAMMGGFANRGQASAPAVNPASPAPAASAAPEKTAINPKTGQRAVKRANSWYDIATGMKIK